MNQVPSKPPFLYFLKLVGFGNRVFHFNDFNLSTHFYLLKFILVIILNQSTLVIMHKTHYFAVLNSPLRSQMRFRRVASSTLSSSFPTLYSTLFCLQTSRLGINVCCYVIGDYYIIVSFILGRNPIFYFSIISLIFMQINMLNIFSQICSILC